MRGVAAASVTRSRLDAHRLRRYFPRLGLADFVAALAGAHFRGAHRGRADPMGILIDLDRHFDIVGRGAKLDHGLERLAANPLEILGLRIGDHAFDHVAHQRQRDADRGNHLGVLGYLVTKAGAAGRVRDQRGGAAAFANQHRLIAIELVFGDEIVDDRDDLVGGDIEDGARGIFDRFADEVGERCDRAPRRLRDCHRRAIRAWHSRGRWRRRCW